MNPPILVWFRQDLRLADNPALQAAAAQGPVLPVFIWAPSEDQEWAPGAASRWWTHQSLSAFDEAIRRRGANLIVRRGETLATLRALCRETGARQVVWNRRYEPASTERDAAIKTALRAEGIRAESFNGNLLHEPWTIQNQSGRPFQVFTAFWRRCLGASDPAHPLPAPERLVAPPVRLESLPLEALELEPRIDWTAGIRRAWTPGESGAKQSLDVFLNRAFAGYPEDRNRPDHAGTSRLSPHLHFGEISPRQVWHALRDHAEKLGLPPGQWRRSSFLAELGWREFAHHLLYHFPHTPTEPLREEFAAFPWRENPVALEAWQRGRTGFPLVDAGMRELWTTGWMHNRVRMVVASFLVKDLLIPWPAGARWFWDTLVDADLASNTLGWQWTAGCGADAAPYFRVFNPMSQGEKFDPEGDYVRRWVPELARLPARWIHRPHEAPSAVLDQAGIELGRDYPAPIVNHSIAREVALEAYQRMKAKAGR